MLAVCLAWTLKILLWCLFCRTASSIPWVGIEGLSGLVCLGSDFGLANCWLYYRLLDFKLSFGSLAWTSTMFGWADYQCSHLSFILSRCQSCTYLSLCWLSCGLFPFPCDLASQSPWLSHLLQWEMSARKVRSQTGSCLWKAWRHPSLDPHSLPFGSCLRADSHLVLNQP